MTTRRALLTAIGMALAITMTSGGTLAQTKWNLPAGYAANNYHSENLVWFSDEVRKATGGALDITVHSGASLFKLPEIKRAVATKQTQMGEVLLALHENEDPVFGLDTIPFLATSYPEAYKLWQAQKPQVAKKLDGQGILLLYAVPWAPNGIYTKKDLNSVDDMKGLKMRVYNVGTTRIAESVGAQAVTVQAAELSQAIATGTVNAFMTSSSTGVDSKVWEIMSHWYDAQAWIPKNITFVNKAAFLALDKAQQDAILKASAAAEERGWKLAPERAELHRNELKAKGMKVLEPSPELNAGLRKIGENLLKEWLQKAGPDGQAVIDAYRK
jgi:TRAP-type C4-dicarboxylate transport system substrate-binding protein